MNNAYLHTTQDEALPATNKKENIKNANNGKQKRDFLRFYTFLNK
jgi:hypothetical protein